jgi:REP element-mobilizing transposase RayT
MRRQLELNLCRGKRGGRRPGAGRKRIHSPGVAHRRREKVHSRHPLHVNFRLKTSLRNKQGLKLLKRAISNSRTHGLKVIHFSLQSNHVHLILEATSNAILTKGMRSLTITFAKGLARGRLQVERYHLHVLKSLRETRNAIHYVLFNEQKHRGMKKAYINDYSSLGLIQELQQLARNAKMTIVLSKFQRINFLDAPAGWIINKALGA